MFFRKYAYMVSNYSVFLLPPQTTNTKSIVLKHLFLTVFLFSSKNNTWSITKVCKIKWYKSV